MTYLLLLMLLIVASGIILVTMNNRRHRELVKQIHLSQNNITIPEQTLFPMTAKLFYEFWPLLHPDHILLIDDDVVDPRVRRDLNNKTLVFLPDKTGDYRIAATLRDNLAEEGRQLLVTFTHGDVTRENFLYREDYDGQLRCIDFAGGEVTDERAADHIQKVMHRYHHFLVGEIFNRVLVP